MRPNISEELERGILQVVMLDGSDGSFENSFGMWRTAIISKNATLSEQFKDPDLLSAFRRLRANGILQFTKFDKAKGKYRPYSGESDGDGFFYDDMFIAKITDGGRTHWDLIRGDGNKTPIGFSS